MAVLHRAETRLNMGRPMGFRCSDETKAKMRLKAKMRGKCSEKTKALMQLHHVGFSGRRHSEEAKAKMRMTRLGHGCSPVTRQRMGRAQEARWARRRALMVEKGICPYLTSQKVFKINCYYFPDRCKKKSHIACPILEIELKRGEQIDRERLEKRIRDMTPEYFHWFHISLPPHERKEAQVIYAKLHSIPVEILDSPRKVNADDTFRSKTRMIPEKT